MMYNVITSNIDSSHCHQVISLPSQLCAFKVKVTETSIVTAADVVTMKGRYFLWSLTDGPDIL